MASVSVQRATDKIAERVENYLQITAIVSYGLKQTGISVYLEVDRWTTQETEIALFAAIANILEQGKPQPPRPRMFID